MIRAILAAITALIFATSASAATFFKDLNSCEAAARAGTADIYVPKTDSPFKGGSGWEKKVVGDRGACLGDAYVLEDGHLNKTGTVFVAKGFEYWVRTGTNQMRMHKCSNFFGQIREIGTGGGVSGDSRSVIADPQQAACEGDGCGNVIRTQTVTHVIREEVVCERRDGSRFQPNSAGECEFGSVPVRVSMSVSATGTCQSCQPRQGARQQGIAPQGQPQRQQAQYEQEVPAANLMQRVVNKDGICGIVVVDPKDSRNVLAKLMLQPYNGESGNPEKIGNLQILQVNEFKRGQVYRVHGEITGFKPGSCPAALDYVESKWALVVQKFSLPNDCKATRLEGSGQTL